MKKIAVVYHSGFGHTEVLAKAVSEGASTETSTSTLIKIHSDGNITDNEWQALNDADGIIFGAPTYMGAASGPFKIFQDATSKPWFQHQWKDKIAGGFTNSGSMSGNKVNTLLQFVTLAMQHGMIWAGPGMFAGKNKENHISDPEVENRLGGYIGAMAQSENESPEISPPTGDVAFAKSYGKRIAEITSKFNS